MMAQEVGYLEDNVVYREGPFVIVNPDGNEWRIEVERKGVSFPVFPDLSIYRIMEPLGLPGKTRYKELAMSVCDTLNQMVKLGKIVRQNNVWVARAI